MINLSLTSEFNIIDTNREEDKKGKAPIWPDDLIKTKWDIQQIEKSYGQGVQSIVEYDFVFAANENTVTIDRDSSADGHKENIYIRAGEKRSP